VKEHVEQPHVYDNTSFEQTLPRANTLRMSEDSPIIFKFAQDGRLRKVASETRAAPAPPPVPYLVPGSLARRDRASDANRYILVTAGPEAEFVWAPKLVFDRFLLR
jgi:hypothetical protein